MSKPSLEDLRRQIDDIDRQIQALISERARCAQRVGELKGSTEKAEFYRPEREAQVLRAVVERNEGPLSNEEMLRLFREIMSACLAQEEPLKVAYLGPEGTFTQSAVYTQFGHSVRALAVSTIEEVFHEVESGVADFGVTPVENSTEGSVNHTLDMFLSSPLKICGEVELRIHQHLLGRMGDLSQIKRICSHSQSFAQCRSWLKQYLPNVENQGDNTTRFLVIGRDMFPPSGNDKTTLLVSATSTQGSGVLLHLLEPLAKHDINMTRIESRPSRRRKWDYVFFVDIDGHAEDAGVKKALEEMRQQTDLFRVLGAYPKAVI
jgi:chorismate mutase/prephenate dehydratase